MYNFLFTYTWLSIRIKQRFNSKIYYNNKTFPFLVIFKPENINYYCSVNNLLFRSSFTRIKCTWNRMYYFINAHMLKKNWDNWRFPYPNCNIINYSNRTGLKYKAFIITDIADKHVIHYNYTSSCLLWTVLSLVDLIFFVLYCFLFLFRITKMRDYLSMRTSRFVFSFFFWLP